jgi:hypothetical protein
MVRLCSKLTIGSNGPRIGYRSRSPAEFGSIRTAGNLDAKSCVRRRGAIILLESLAHLSGADSDYRILSSRIVSFPVIDLNSNGALLQIVYLPSKAIVDHIGEELPAPVAASKSLATEDSLQFEKDDLLCVLVWRL